MFCLLLLKSLNVCRNISPVIAKDLLFCLEEAAITCVPAERHFPMENEGPLTVLLKFIVLKYITNKVLASRYSWLCYRIEKQNSYPLGQAHSTNVELLLVILSCFFFFLAVILSS